MHLSRRQRQNDFNSVNKINKVFLTRQLISLQKVYYNNKIKEVHLQKLSEKIFKHL